MKFEELKETLKLCWAALFYGCVTAACIGGLVIWATFLWNVIPVLVKTYNSL